MGLVTHVSSLLFLAVLIVGPVPLCLVLTGSDPSAARARKAESALGLIVAWCVIQVEVALLLGILGHLRPPAVLLAEMALALAGCLALACASPRSVGGGAEAARAALPRIRSETLLAGATASVGGALLLRLATRPVSEYDSLAYHLPVMARWYQSGAFVMLDQFFQKSRYPYNWEALCTLFFMPFRDDFMVTLPNLAAWALFGLSVYLVSLELGAARRHALASTLLVLTLPLVVEQVNSMRVDLPLAALFMASLFLLVSYRRTRSLSRLALFLAALGVLAGTKPSAPVYVALLLGGFGALEVLGRAAPDAGPAPRAPAARWPTLRVAFAVLSLLVPGAFWYVRNLIEIGNPVGFVRVRLFGVTVLSSTYDLIDLSDIRRTTLAHLFDPTKARHWAILLEQLWGQFGPAVFLLAAEAGLLLACLRGRHRRIQPGRAIAASLLLAITLALYTTTPYSADVSDYTFRISSSLGGELRFALPFVGVLGIVAALGATSTPTLGTALVGAALLSAGFALFRTGLAGVVLVLLAGWVASRLAGVEGWLRVRARRGGPAGRLAAVAVIAGLLTGGTLALRADRVVERKQLYGGLPEYIETHVGPGERLGYLLSDRSYLFYGPHWDRAVLYTPARSESLAQWRQLLAAERVTLVAIGPVDPSWRSFGEPAWLATPKGPFTRVFGDDPSKESVLYRIEPRAGPGPTP